MIEMKDGCVYRKGMLWIPNDENLIRQILESEHDTKVAVRGSKKHVHSGEPSAGHYIRVSVRRL